ncbi:trehalose-phosphatase [Nesterenkonia flava]|uniref:Trehalose 6-phosphate phosphatase n=1 Tax=Nesterenkonia flava TaxID=469799 RepID=A0ABU1FW99_9MICC|nr:trehalose-phosphatase [Nesterenkonia flava]MDR5712607.1 trehalose-phosphatase [Nesterenkonia flava]
MTSPHTALPSDLDNALQRFAAEPQVLVCLDFDGCVAELVADAGSARPVPANAEAINALAPLEGITLAYISGRPLETLRELSSPPEGTLLVGSHGAEKYLGPDSPGLQLSPKEEMARRSVIETLEGVAAQHEGAWVEHKPAGAAIHVRRIEDRSRGEEVLNEARAALAVLDGAHIKEGKQILESVVVLSTKGEAIEELRELLRPAAVLFAGDDVTDEHGFAVLREGDVGVKVGDGETKAAFRIPEPAALANVLNRLVELRGAGSVGGETPPRSRSANADHHT